MSLTDTLKDRARAVVAAGDDVQTAIVKATNHDEVAPKSKHLVSMTSFLGKNVETKRLTFTFSSSHPERHLGLDSSVGGPVQASE